MTDTTYMTAKEKELVLKAWKTFIKNGLKWEHFTDRLYKHLINNASFIAHYNRLGFYDTYFERPEDTARFLQQFDIDYGNLSVEYGGTWWLTQEDYNDINSAMCQAIEPFKLAIYSRCLENERERDVTYAKALLSKHGISVGTAQ